MAESGEAGAAEGDEAGVVVEVAGEETTAETTDVTKIFKDVELEIMVIIKAALMSNSHSKQTSQTKLILVPQQLLPHNLHKQTPMMASCVKQAAIHEEIKIKETETFDETIVIIGIIATISAVITIIAIDVEALTTTGITTAIEEKQAQRNHS